MAEYIQLVASLTDGGRPRPSAEASSSKDDRVLSSPSRAAAAVRDAGREAREDFELLVKVFARSKTLAPHVPKLVKHKKALQPHARKLTPHLDLLAPLLPYLSQLLDELPHPAAWPKWPSWQGHASSPRPPQRAPSASRLLSAP